MKHLNNFNDFIKEAENRIARKPGQKANSDKHSDLYTDENPEGTIHGLGFKDADTANKSIDIIKKADREHAHKVQATLVMQQRAKVAIERTKDPEKKKNLKAAYEIWSKFLEEMKKKTKELNNESYMVDETLIYRGIPHSLLKDMIPSEMTNVYNDEDRPKVTKLLKDLKDTINKFWKDHKINRKIK